MYTNSAQLESILFPRTSW